MPTALVLTGGGARGAYQAGALTELLPFLHAEGRVPTIMTGASVGALNAAAVAANAHLPVDDQVGALVSAWASVTQRDVMRPFVTQVPRLVARYATELSPFPGPRLRGLVDSTPLRRTLQRWVDWDQLAANTADDGPVHTLMVMATEVVSGSSTAFIAGTPPEAGMTGLDDVPTVLGADHLVASASIPMLFEATKIESPPEAAGWYCDGSTRLARPVSPSIAAGADDLVVVSPTVPERARRRPAADATAEPDLADVAVNVLEALMTDVLVDDLERCAQRGSPCLVIAPEDPDALGTLARETLEANHRGVFSVLRSDIPLIDWALGGGSPRQGELLSYLLFDQDFLEEAMAMGARDARRILGT